MASVMVRGPLLEVDVKVALENSLTHRAAAIVTVSARTPVAWKGLMIGLARPERVRGGAVLFAKWENVSSID